MIVSATIYYDVFATTYKCTGMYRSDVEFGIAYYGPDLFHSYKGYTPNTLYNQTISQWIYEMNHSRVLFMHTHGAPGRITLDNSNTMLSALYMSSISYSSVPRMVYLSACECGKNSPIYGNIGNTLVNKGVGCVVAFEEEIRYPIGHPESGCNLYDLKTINYLTHYNYTIHNASLAAESDIIDLLGWAYGCDSRIIYGNSYMKFVC